VADHADIGVIGFRPRAGEKDVVEITGGDFCQFLGQHDSRGMGGLEKGVVIRQLHHLPVSGIGQFLAVIAKIYAPQPGHAIKQFFTFTVPKVNTLCSGDNPGTFGIQAGPVGKGVNVMSRIKGL